MADRPDGRRTRYEHRRGEILAAVFQYALDHGVTDLTLRGAARAVGVSHATLVHHFATRDALVAEIVDEALTRTLYPPQAEAGGGWDQAYWDYLCGPDGRRATRLFVSLIGLAVYEGSQYSEPLQRSMRTRVADLAAGFVAIGCPPEEAAATATSFMARLRGLLIDLLVTDDEERVNAAFALLIQDGVARRARWAAIARGDDPAAP